MVAEADFIGSTKGIIDWVHAHKPKLAMLVIECSMATSSVWAQGGIAAAMAAADSPAVAASVTAEADAYSGPDRPWHPL